MSTTENSDNNFFLKKFDICLSLFTSLNPNSYEVTKEENYFSENLSLRRKIEYLTSRTYLRQFLSLIFDIEPLKIPLYSPPAKPPQLKNGFGYVSLSHSKNGFLVGWSSLPIGVDIEQRYRKFNEFSIIQKLFSEEEKSLLKKFSKEKLRDKCLDLWVIKEASIKLQRGSIFEDFKQWRYDDDEKTVSNLINGEKKSINNFNFNEFKIAVAYDLNINKEKIILCYH
ncbi:4'-phosphopantetheinyl transferase superfamily protein [uncultured Prochlorococcus sp.]|uniref:4'-phosphopantetheinyl transferase family protein n=1 Tax=uncultured Prochlorococcus sp. TaxID=159733 RepID=UPI00258301C9|nr:4'-phosphopantetheinyl transferase superfamily protein [uncultured Prochlorococcus sp.]